MVQKITGEAPFQVLATNFSIGPSNEGYTLQISADGVNYSDLFSVGANVTRMVTGVASGSFYKLSGNASEVSINWRTQCNDGGSGGSGSQGPQGPAGGGSGSGSQGPQGPQGESGATGADGAQGPAGNDGATGADGAQGPQGANGIEQAPTILKSVSGTPEGIVDGDVYAFKGEVEVDIPSTEVFSAVTVTIPNKASLTFKFYQGGQYKDYTVNVSYDGAITAPWGVDTENHIINGGWANTGIHYEKNGYEWTFTSLTEGISDYQIFYMYGFDPALKRMELQRNTYQYELTGTTTMVSGTSYSNKRTVTTNIYRLPTEKTLIRTITAMTGTVYLLYLNPNFTAEIWASGGTEYLALVEANDVNTLVEYEEGAYFNIKAKTSPVMLGFVTVQGQTSSITFSSDEVKITGPVYSPVKLAKLSDMPAEDRLIPTGGTDGDVVMHNFTGIQWTSRNSIVVDGMSGAWPYSAETGDRQVLVRKGNWDYEWNRFEINELTAVDELPAPSDDGKVYAYASGGSYSIAQVQSGETGWLYQHYASNVPTGWIQARVLFAGTNESNMIGVYFGNSTEEISLYWHPERSENKWDGLPSGTEQNNDGEFTATTADGTITAVKTGKWVLVNFSQAVTAVERTEGTTELFTEGVIPTYRHAVMSDTPMKLWKGTSAEYGQLPAVDPNTLYIII